jgi:hypothetical protein
MSPVKVGEFDSPVLRSVLRRQFLGGRGRMRIAR